MSEVFSMQPGDKVRVKEDVYDEGPWTWRVLAATSGSIGTIASLDEYAAFVRPGPPSRLHLRAVKKWMEKGYCLPVKIERVMPPSQATQKYWKERGTELVLGCAVGNIILVGADNLEKLSEK